MKVVLFCGGHGMRMRQGVDDFPKPMTLVGDRPLLWHVMRYYAHFGHRDFVLCLGYGASQIKDYFLHYEETKSNDFVLRRGGREVELITNDIEDWTITFVQTGLDTPIGERLRRVGPFLDGEEMFLANYADVLTDAPLDELVQRLAESSAAGLLLAVPPQAAFHVVEVADDDSISEIHSVSSLQIRENGGYFVLRREVLDSLGEGEDLVDGALTRLAADGRLRAYPYDGFWMAADTPKERAQLDSMFNRGVRPWALWERPPGRSGRAGTPASQVGARP